MSSSSSEMYSHHQMFFHDSSTSSSSTSSLLNPHLPNPMNSDELLRATTEPDAGTSSASVPVKREKRKYRCRKRSPATIERAKTVRRDKANARERRRMNSLNDALEVLREILPSMPDEPKMTKIETLRKAQEYIASLTYQLSTSSSSTSSSPESAFSANFCESGCSSLHSTPFQSPCFPDARGAYPPYHIAYPTTATTTTTFHHLNHDDVTHFTSQNNN